MADTSSSRLSTLQVAPLLQKTQQTVISDESMIEQISKSNIGMLNSGESKKKVAQQYLQQQNRIDDKKISVRSQAYNPIMRQEHPLAKDQSSTIVLSEGDIDMTKDDDPFLIIEDESKIQVDQVVQEQQNLGIQQSLSTQQNAMKSTKDKMNEKRSSITNYHKRVVELQINNQSKGKEQLLKVAPQTMKNKGSNQMSLNISEIPCDILQKATLSNNQSSQNSRLILSNEKAPISARNSKKAGQISQNISPKTTTLFGSPRFSMNQMNKNLNLQPKPKIMLRKQAQDLQSLNKSEQIMFSVNSSQDHKIAANLSVQNFKHHNGSPNLSKLIQVHNNFKSNQNSNSKKPLANSSSSSQLLIRNLSSENANKLRVCDSQRDITKPLTDLPSQRSQLNQAKRGSIRHYSPTQMTLNKALSRISSVGELSKYKHQNQLQQQRKSIGKIQNGSIASMQTAAALAMMNSSSKQSDDYLFDPVSQCQTNNKGNDEDTSNDYITNQEKLWNAIETGANLQTIQELLQRKDVQVEAKNAFDDGWTALHYAVHEGMFEVVKLLVEDHSATIDPRSATNKTPFHLACIRGEHQLIKYLLDHGSNSQSVDRDGCSPLHYLCETENHEMINFLLPLALQSKDVRNRFGKKPADLVRDKEIKKLLRNFNNRRDSQIRQNQQRQSQSRERSKSIHHNSHAQNTVKVLKLKEDKDAFESIKQMFRKFSLYKQTAQYRSDGKKVVEDKLFERKKSTQNTKVSDKPLESDRKYTQPTSGRLTIGVVKNPQSTKNANKPTLQPKTMFNPAKQTSIKANISPLKPHIISRPQTTLQASQSQRNLNQKTSNKESIKRKLESVKSLSNINCYKIDQIHSKEEKIVEVDSDDDYNIISVNRKGSNEKANKIKNEIIELEDHRGSSSQRTGESSHIMNNNDLMSPSNIYNKNHKLTTFSMNRMSDITATAPETQIEQQKKEEKVGPWSFIAHQLLGTGSFGEVFLVEKTSNHKYFAMKVLTKAKIMGHNLTRYALTERNVMSVVDHPFIVKLNYAFQTQEKLFLILDYCPGGDLAEYLQLEKRFNEDKVRLYSSEILLALEELHRKDIIFRDLKPDNVVLDAEGHAMLTDFGLSKEGVMREGMAKSFCGSYAYLAPEMLKKIGHGKAVDWYLLGVIIYEMLCGVPPYYANNKDELFENIKTAPLDLPSYLSPLARDLILKLLNRNPNKRLGTYGGADEIKKHAFFKTIDWQKLFNRAYKAPEPYLRKRFDNFLTMSPQNQTNTEVYESLRQQALFKGPYSLEQHVPGWSFVSPVKE